MKNYMKLMGAALAVATLAFTIPSPSYKVGDETKDFNLKNIDGKMVSLNDYKDAKGFIIIFTCNHCPFSKAYEQRIVALDKKYASVGYPVIAINSNDSATNPEDSYGKMIENAKEKGFTFPYLYDESQNIAKQYGALKTPHVYILKKNKNGNKVEYTGAIDDNSEDASLVKVKYVENAVDELIAGKALTTKETKAIGCGVKYRK
ncbi:MAG: thioredoxin family protein [Bacteroidia bacterium]|nr:thioredoxin family protein [Bacteroidia bacterium]